MRPAAAGSNLQDEKTDGKGQVRVTHLFSTKSGTQIQTQTLDSGLGHFPQRLLIPEAREPVLELLEITCIYRLVVDISY